MKDEHAKDAAQDTLVVYMPIVMQVHSPASWRCVPRHGPAWAKARWPAALSTSGGLGRYCQLGSPVAFDSGCREALLGAGGAAQSASMYSFLKFDLNSGNRGYARLEFKLGIMQTQMTQKPVLRVAREHGSCLMPPTHMFAHHRGGQRQPTPGNARRPSPTPITTVSHTHRTPTWTWTFIQPKPHTHPADITRESKRAA